MSQKFGLIEPNRNIGSCSEDINQALLALVSCFSGTAWPTNKWIGMLCLRTDENKLYQLRSNDSVEDWILIADLSRSGTDAITAERLAKARKINEVVFDGTKDIVLDTTRSFTAPKTAAGSVDFNSLVNAGTYAELVSGTNPNGPGDGDLFFVNVYVNNTNVVQCLAGYKNNKCYMRNRNTNVWSKWECFIRASDMPVKLPANGGNADTVGGKSPDNKAGSLALKTSDNDLAARTLVATMEDERKMSGALAFRIDGVKDNSLRFCADPTEILKWLGNPVFVVESWRDGLSWYRVYSDGWCEQGGVAGYFYQSSASVKFHKSYKDTNYSVMLSTDAGHSSGDKRFGYRWVRSTKEVFSVSAWFEESSGNVFWEAKGYIK